MKATNPATLNETIDRIAHRIVSRYPSHPAPTEYSMAVDKQLSMAGFNVTASSLLRTQISRQYWVLRGLEKQVNNVAA